MGVDSKINNFIIFKEIKKIASRVLTILFQLTQKYTFYELETYKVVQLEDRKCFYKIQEH